MPTNPMFSNFVNQGELEATDIVVGLRSGVNSQFTYNGGISPSTIVAVANGGTGASSASSARANLGLVIGSDIQAWGANLDALSDLASTGMIVQTGAGTFINRVISGTSNQITATNGSGVSANPTLSLSATLTLPGTLTLGGIMNVNDFAITNSVTNGNLSLTTNGSGKLVLNSTTGVASILDEDTMSSDSATALATQQSIKAYVDASVAAASKVATGTIIDFGGTSAPTGYLACDGAAVSRTTYATLFGVIGTTWGVGDGSSTFNLPNFQRRTSVGSGGAGTGVLGNAVGDTGGAETITLTTNQIPAHTHESAALATASSSKAIGAGALEAAAVGTVTGSTGGGLAHDNIQPSAVVLKCIKT